MREVFELIFNMSASEITTAFIAAQAVGLLTAVAAAAGAQCKKMTSVLILNLISNSLVALSYILLGGISGSYVCIAASVQTVISYLYTRKNEDVPKIITGVFICIYIALSVYTYKTPIDVIPAICAVMYALSVVQSKSSGYRVFMGINSVLWVIYDIVIGAFTMIITHGLLLTSIIIAMIRYDIKKNTESQMNNKM